jgi:hypothetical protein
MEWWPPVASKDTCGNMAIRCHSQIEDRRHYLQRVIKAKENLSMNISWQSGPYCNLACAPRIGPYIGQYTNTHGVFRRVSHCLVDVATNLQITRVISRGLDRSCDSFVMYNSMEVLDMMHVTCICLSMRRLGNVKVKVKQSHYRPGETLNFAGGWGNQISRQSAHEGGKVFSLMHRPPLPPRRYS